MPETLFEAVSDHGVSPCFVNCGEPACQRLGCVRVHNAEHRDDQKCTGLSASWCPIHGDCLCDPQRDDGLNYPDCPLHGIDSAHGC